MQQSPSSEANRFSASQEIPPILWNQKFQCRIYKCPQPVPILSQISPIHVHHPTSQSYIIPSIAPSVTYFRRQFTTVFCFTPTRSNFKRPQHALYNRPNFYIYLTTEIRTVLYILHFHITHQTVHYVQYPYICQLKT